MLRHTCTVLGNRCRCAIVMMTVKIEGFVQVTQQRGYGAVVLVVVVDVINLILLFALSPSSQMHAYPGTFFLL